MHVMVDKTKRNKLIATMKREGTPSNSNNIPNRELTQPTTTPRIVEVASSVDSNNTQAGRLGQTNSATATSADYSVQSPR